MMGRWEDGERERERRKREDEEGEIWWRVRRGTYIG